MQNKSISDSDTDYRIIHRNIKYPRLELKTGNLILIVPHGYKDPEKLIEEHENWIKNKIIFINESKERSKDNKLNYKRNEDELRTLIHKNIDIFSNELEVKPNQVKLRIMKSKWGSCSSKKNMNFNKLLKYIPDDLIQYVVLHEITHLKENKHNQEFWNIISEFIKDYKRKEEELMDYWFLIQTETNEFIKDQ